MKTNSMILRINISSKNSNELLDALKRIDISVPSRSVGQKKEFRERWSMYRLLATLCKTNILNFPLICIHDDKPDFYLRHGVNEIGIEVADAIHQDYAHAEYISENIPGTLVDPDLFINGKRFSYKEINDIAKRTRLTAPGWEGDDDEREIQWAKGILKSIEHKTKKLREKDFKKYTKNMLLIFDGLQLTSLNMEKALLQLNTELAKYWSSKNKIFDTVFIEKSTTFYKIFLQGFKEFPVENLWASTGDIK